MIKGRRAPSDSEAEENKEALLPVCDVTTGAGASLVTGLRGLSKGTSFILTCLVETIMLHSFGGVQLVWVAGYHCVWNVRRVNRYNLKSTNHRWILQ